MKLSKTGVKVLYWTLFIVLAPIHCAGVLLHAIGRLILAAAYLLLIHPKTAKNQIKKMFDIWFDF